MNNLTYLFIVGTSIGIAGIFILAFDYSDHYSPFPKDSKGKLIGKSMLVIGIVLDITYLILALLIL